MVKKTSTRLSKFKSTQRFEPRLHLKNHTSNAFTKAYNSREHRFDVGASATERDRLLQRKLLAVQIGTKHTLEFLNEDQSQIPSQCNLVEHQAYAMTRSACARLNVLVQRLDEDANGPIDFRVGAARNQDKALANAICVRQKGKYPYNPDHFDILQITDISNRQVWALPMRTYRAGLIVSFFSEAALMKGHLGCGIAWKDAHKQYHYDMKTEEGIRAYVDACCLAASTPELSDKKWYMHALVSHMHTRVAA